MGLTQSALITQGENEPCNPPKALAHHVRIALCEFLPKSQTCINRNLVQYPGHAQAAISQYLQEFKSTTFYRATDGDLVSYCINPIW